MQPVNSNETNRKTHHETYFAPVARASAKTLQQNIETISHNPIVDTVMNVVAGLVAVLNKQRQILTINDTLLQTLGIDDADEVLGLRLGETIHCIHAQEQPGGCGTSKFCTTCGAAIAITTSLANNSQELRECVATVERNGKHIDLYFQVRCCPLTFKGERFLLLFLQDITIQQQQAALGRAFFHDINNTIGALILNSQLLDMPNNAQRTDILAKRIKKLSTQLGKEVEIQSVLSYKGAHTYQVIPQCIVVQEIFKEIHTMFANHPMSKNKTLSLPKPIPGLQLTTDISLLRRILTNMLVNALEATDTGGEVRLWLDETRDRVTFCVWNKKNIPENIALRVFQRNFSTKAESGRGLGTYAMKLFGETYLGGKVSFTTSRENGTEFRLCLPKKLAANCLAT